MNPIYGVVLCGAFIGQVCTNFVMPEIFSTSTQAYLTTYVKLTPQQKATSYMGKLQLNDIKPTAKSKTKFTMPVSTRPIVTTIQTIFEPTEYSTATGPPPPPVIPPVPAGPDTTKPSAPMNVVATAVSRYQVDLTWKASTDNVGVTGYMIYRDGSLLKKVTGTSGSDGGLIPGRTYEFHIIAFDAAGNIAPSNGVSVTTFP